MNKKLTRILHVLLALLIGLTSVMTLAQPPIARATDHQDENWRVEKWAEKKWTEAGAVIVYNLRVTRVGPPASGVTIMDNRDINTHGYGDISPAPDAGGGTNFYARWDVDDMGPGDSFLARYEVHVNSGLLDGTKISNALEVGPGGISMDHVVVVGDEPWNDTAGANSGAQPVPPDPINAGTGEYYVDPILDFDLGGPLPLTFSRYYASGLQDEGVVTSTLGANWMHNYDLRINWPDSIVTYERGKLIYFVHGSLNFHQEPVPFRLEKVKWDGSIGSHYWLLDPIRERLYRFDSIGLLQEIRDRNDNRLLLTYDGDKHLSRVADDLGRVLTFTHTADTLTQVTDGMRHVDLAYNGNGHLATATDAVGEQTSYAYAANLSHGPLMTGQTRPAGNTPYLQTYNGSGQAIQQADAYANTTTSEYDTPAPGQTRVTDPAGVQIVTHEDRRLGTAIQDRADNAITFDFDDRERVTAVHDRLGDSTALTYHDESGKIASYTDAEGYTTTFTYTAQTQAFTNPITPSEVVTFTFYNLTQMTHSDSTTETFAYDERGNVTVYTDRAGQTWQYQYNTRGQVTRITNPAGGEVDYAYNADGTLATSTDADVGITAYGYDAYRRLNLLTRPDGSTVQFTYDDNDRLLTVTDELGQTTTFSYDANGNLETAANPLDQTVTYAHDLMDRLAGRTDPLGRASAYAYDEMGLLETFTNRNGHTWTYSYDDRGWPTAVADPAGHTWTMAYDDEGVPTAFTTPLGHTTEFQTDKLGRTTHITDPLGAYADLGYDELGRLISARDRVGRTTSYAYDDAGRLAGVTRSGPGTASYARNDLGQLARITDLRGKQWDFGYSTMGRRTSHSDPLGQQWTYAYDDRGRLDQVTYPGGLGAAAITHDDAGQVTQAAHPGGPILTYTYDNAGRLLMANDLALAYDARGDVANSQDGAASFAATYDDGQRVQTVTYDGQATVTYTYDGRNLLTRVQDDRAGAWLTFAYDDDGRLTMVNRSNGVSTAFTYDNAGRVTRIQDGALAEQQYTLNAEGEPVGVARTLPLDPAPPVPLLSLAFDDAGQISTSGYAYDARGRQTAAPGVTYAYDGATRLTQISSGTLTVDLAYNGLGDLRARTAGGTTTTYYHNYALGLSPTVAEAEGGTYQRFYVYTPGGRLLYAIDPATNQVHFYHYDRLGSTLFLTDGGGSVSDAYAYDPYGNLLGHTGSSDQPFTYVGAYGVRREPAGNLYHMRARYYDPLTTRFLTRDPVWPVLVDPRSLNPYQYAYQNPLQYIDPLGSFSLLTSPYNYNRQKQDGEQKEKDKSVSNVELTPKQKSEREAYIIKQAMYWKFVEEYEKKCIVPMPVEPLPFSQPLSLDPFDAADFLNLGSSWSAQGDGSGKGARIGFPPPEDKVQYLALEFLAEFLLPEDVVLPDEQHSLMFDRLLSLLPDDGRYSLPGSRREAPDKVPNNSDDLAQWLSQADRELDAFLKRSIDWTTYSDDVHTIYWQNSR